MLLQVASLSGELASVRRSEVRYRSEVELLQQQLAQQEQELQQLRCGVINDASNWTELDLSRKAEIASHCALLSGKCLRHTQA